MRMRSGTNSVLGAGEFLRNSHIMDDFTVGQLITLRADPGVSGAIIRIIAGDPENRYEVFHDGKTSFYYASQLQAHAAPQRSREILSLDAFHAYLTALQLRHPGLAALYSLHASRVDFIPYQFRPVLKFIRADRPRLLIADEVGVGKTIEAGLILRELQARMEVKSVLIICPRPLVVDRKWALEMRRFDERFLPLDGPKLRYCLEETHLDGAWPDQYSRAILPFSLFNDQLLHGGEHGQPRGLLDLDPPPRFDLVIVDEAHHLRNADTYVHRGVRFLCENAEAVVFLTATPIQLGSDDLFVLLNLLRPDLVIDRATFEHMAEPNPHLNSAIETARRATPGWQEEASEALQRAANTNWGQAVLRNDPEYQRICDQLREANLSTADRVACIRAMELLHTFARLINRTRRRDIGAFTVRKPETVSVEFTPEQKELHDALLDTQARILSAVHGDQNVAFMMSTIRRQAASCLHGLAPLLRTILTRRFDEGVLEAVDDTFTPPDGGVLLSIDQEIRNVVAKAERLSNDDPKFGALLGIIRSKQSMPNNKLLLFSTFRHTLSYLFGRLYAQGLRIGLVHGGTPDEERQSLRNRFSLPADAPTALDVLLSSEVGCEGLDYQFCDGLVNYDLPWNPMRIEQRIGRVDRYGQRSETVVIYNLITPGTVDADIYERCLLRIGVFRQALGGSEEILGRITQELHSVADNLDLTEDQRRERLQQLADNEIRLLEEQAALEEKQADLFGIRLPQQQTEREIHDASSFWLSPAALQSLVQYYLESRCGLGHQYILGQGPIKTLRLGQDARSQLINDFRQLPRQPSAIHREWEAWMKGSDPVLSITFESTAASDRRDVTFITPVHPLAQQAACTLFATERAISMFRVRDEQVAAGSHPFAIYKWSKRGIRDDVSLQPVCADATLRQRFLELLEQASPQDASQLPDDAVFDDLDKHHHRVWSEARAAHQAHTQQLARYRRESLQTSHRARLAILNEQLTQSGDDRIRRMRQAQIARADADVERRLAELNAAETNADIMAQPVAFGVMIVEVN